MTVEQYMNTVSSAEHVEWIAFDIRRNEEAAKEARLANKGMRSRR